jgi:hypothetical protein
MKRLEKKKRDAANYSFGRDPAAMATCDSINSLAACASWLSSALKIFWCSESEQAARSGRVSELWRALRILWWSEARICLIVRLPLAS